MGVKQKGKYAHAMKVILLRRSGQNLLFLSEGIAYCSGNKT